MNLKNLLFSFLALACQSGLADENSLTPYTEGSVPGNVVDLWSEIDFRKDPLDTEVVREWIEDGVVIRYVLFTVGTFKGETSRIAAFYTFPEGAENAPAFVWAHGGGQRAERERGIYFAKQGFATIDLNWGGREIFEGIEKNTDWGAVDPSQGPKFYPGALREQTKLNFLPDEHTIDPVLSPRNGNWFLLTYAGRRAITFLEKQPEVDAEKIGFTGYSMGGNITSYASIDPRLKAVIPMVGGAGFITSDFPGVPDSGRAKGYHDHAELFAKTMESQFYYPQTKCPVLFLSATDDFHSAFDHIYAAMETLPHDHWRVSQHLHFNHNLGPEQWILINRWFDQYLTGKAITHPETPDSTFSVAADNGSATYSVVPDKKDLTGVEFYYSHDPNPRSRFWIQKEANVTDREGKRVVELPLRDHLPLFVFANCTYRLDAPAESLKGTASTFTITSKAAAHYPESLDPTLLDAEATPRAVFSNIQKDGFRDWGFHPNGGITTYKFRDPRATTPEPEARLKVTINAPRKRLSYRFRITKNKYIAGVKDPQTNFSLSREISEPGKKELVFAASDFIERDKSRMTDWSNISTFTIDVYDGEAKSSLHFTDEANRDVVLKLEWLRD
ncbi:MAG: dienelactone hydrolase family protein [Verrucomicrobiales bacterium]|nr:dienelactone hydrolase family protein [Verrucomicrobiales bacterium]